MMEYINSLWKDLKYTQEYNMHHEQKCIICKEEVLINGEGYTCKRCGSYKISGKIDLIGEEYRSIISGYVREHQESDKILELTTEVIRKIKSKPMPNIEEKIIKLMQWLYRQTTFPGQSIQTTFNEHPELIAICYAKNSHEIDYFADYLINRKYLEFNPAKQYKITIDGLKYLETIKPISNSDTCFCAMSFNPENNYIYDDIFNPGATNAGYRIIRVDRNPHNEGIYDEIIASIRRSKFVIADLTENNNGVYYEAGFAKGLGKSVIFTCEKDDFEKIHFDVKHINILRWDKTNIEDAVDRLHWRIESTLGRGPHY